MKKNVQWPQLPVRSAENARGIFEKQVDRLMPPHEMALVFADPALGGGQVRPVAPRLPTEEECERGIPRLPVALFKRWTVTDAVRAAWWAYRLAIPSARLVRRRDRLVALAAAIEGELGALSEGLTDEELDDPRVAAVWTGLRSAITAIACTRVGTDIAGGTALFNHEAEGQQPRASAIANLSPRNVAAALLLHHGLPPLLASCALIALDLLDDDDRAALGRNGIDLRAFADTIRRMRNREALADLGLGSLYTPGLIGVAGPGSWLPTDYLGVNDQILRLAVFASLPADSRTRIGRASLRTTLAEDELAASGLTAEAMALGYNAAPVEVIIEEVARTFSAWHGRRPRRADLLTDDLLFRPIGLRLARSAEKARVGADGGPELLPWILSEHGADVALHAAAILALRLLPEQSKSER